MAIPAISQSSGTSQSPISTSRFTRIQEKVSGSIQTIRALPKTTLNLLQRIAAAVRDFFISAFQCAKGTLQRLGGKAAPQQIIVPVLPPEPAPMPAASVPTPRPAPVATPRKSPEQADVVVITPRASGVEQSKGWFSWWR